MKKVVMLMMLLSAGNAGADIFPGDIPCVKILIHGNIRTCCYTGINNQKLSKDQLFKYLTEVCNETTNPSPLSDVKISQAVAAATTSKKVKKHKKQKQTKSK